MSSGNGADISQVLIMLGDVLSVQREMRTELHELRRRVDDIDHKLGSLRQAVTEYHASVLGHGILITELDVRLRRVEQHLNLVP